MKRMFTVVRIAIVATPMLASLGCQARQMADHYLSFDSVITDIYERHVLHNLARRDGEQTMVQMNFKSFSADLKYATSLSAKVKIFADVVDEDGTTGVAVQAFRQSFEPNISVSGNAGLGVSAGPASHQQAVRELYDQQVNLPPEQRIYQRTRNPYRVAKAYCWVRTGWAEWYFVPEDKRRVFCDFVHKVCFPEENDG